MKWNLKKMWPAAAASLVFFTSLVNAASDEAQMRNLEHRVSALEQRKGANGMINPPARPPVTDSADLFITADFIYWQAFEDGLGFAVKSEQAPGTTTPTFVLTDSDMQNVDFSWDPGFKVGVGVNLPHDGWDIYANWIHFINRANQDVDTVSGEFIYPTFQTPNEVFTFATDATANWTMRLNNVDLELGREFFVSKWMTLRPHIGLRSSWISQKYRVHYTGSDIDADDIGTSDKIRMKNRFWGLGLRTGLDTLWGMGCGWSFFGNGAFSLLRGNFKTGQKETLSQTTLGTPFVINDIDNRFHEIKAAVDLTAGLCWDHNFYDDSYRIGFAVAWEYHMFFGQNQLLNQTQFGVPGKAWPSNGDLSMQGLTVSAKFDF